MFNAVKNSLQNYALYRTRQHLLTLSDRQLTDVGISRTLLRQGISSWPWREDLTETPQLTAQPERMSAKQVNAAVRELSRMDDKQLRDIGIDRGTIRHSVVHGISGRGPQRAA